MYRLRKYTWTFKICALLALCACSSNPEDSSEHTSKEELMSYILHHDLNAVHSNIPSKYKCTDKLSLGEVSISVYDYIVFNGSPEMLEYVTSVDRHALSYKDGKGRTALHRAVGSIWTTEEWSLEKVKILINSGADVNAYEDSGLTPLHIIARFKFVDMSATKKEILTDMAKLFIENGGDLYMRNDAGKSALDLFKENGWDDLLMRIKKLDINSE